MNYLQKNLLDSSASVLIQALTITKKSQFSFSPHKSETKHKYLLNNAVVRELFNKHLLSGSIRRFLWHEFNTTKASKPSEVNWMRLIKVTRSPASAASTIVRKLTRPTFTENQICSNTNCSDLSEKNILCIGGRGKLYPEYRCLIKSLGGNFLIYRGNQKGDTDRLPNLLTRADMVVCPVDCVHHETYFAVKSYCKKTNKPCALLERSDLPTFRKGIETLAETTISST